jgi:hypothetical protein
MEGGGKATDPRLATWQLGSRRIDALIRWRIAARASAHSPRTSGRIHIYAMGIIFHFSAR